MHVWALLPWFSAFEWVPVTIICHVLNIGIHVRIHVRFDDLWTEGPANSISQLKWVNNNQKREPEGKFGGVLSDGHGRCWIPRSRYLPESWALIQLIRTSLLTLWRWYSLCREKNSAKLCYLLTCNRSETLRYHQLTRCIETAWLASRARR